MFPDVKTQPTDAQVEGFTEPSMVPTRHSREAAQRLWAESAACSRAILSRLQPR